MVNVGLSKHAVQLFLKYIESKFIPSLLMQKDHLKKW